MTATQCGDRSDDGDREKALIDPRATQQPAGVGTLLPTASAGGAGARRQPAVLTALLDQLACVVAPLAGPGPASDFRCRIMVPECAVAAWHLAPMHADPGSLSALPIRASPSMRFAGRERKLRSAWTSTTHPMTMTRRRCLAPAALIP